MDAFNDADADTAAALLHPCCASTAWAKAIVAGRPYPGLDAVIAASDPVVKGLSWADVEEALAAHPRIGDRPKVAATTEKRWSQGEQAGVADADQEVLAALADGNAAYEARFGHVYLVCASGKSAEELLGILQDRLDNDPAHEHDVVRGELAAITRLRLAKLFS
ncbi:2-oxo-4-hydroxy-4-carboxy-5-ureidoimidazoline decarboxylase [Cryptosporangium arvum]|uniref:2-oxo-4-hydroxy-4-carboxy-5-ureidoimidazoline decarboxylase n=1 Tax=Cryptosporangium arvum DSM 44712 TaxID=927661 RepID=A0A010YIZ2_9ACTN|nr:2-oxo-4-hydroxy-4-carboxy-5-ureidoimidazoline decarboxylase [Cryptosporangium arvum]EXG80200.1 OHCU decarboxylase [Cryptosporangium arvum DSM 44712]